MNPPTDLIIPVHGSRTFPVEKTFEKCVETVCQHTKNFRFIFVDDASDEACRAVVSRVAAAFPECNLIQTMKQHWFTRAVNLGLRLVRTPYAMVLNCDTVVDSGWLEELYDVQDIVEKESGRVGLIGSVLSGEEPRRYALSVGQDYVTGHAWLLNMAAMQEASFVHGTPGLYLDETKADTIHIRSDVYICWDLNKLGWNCVKSFKSAVGHISGQSWGQILGLIPGSLDAVNYKY